MTTHESNMLEQRRGDAEYRVVQAAKKSVDDPANCRFYEELKHRVNELLAIESEAAAGKDGQG